MKNYFQKTIAEGILTEQCSVAITNEFINSMRYIAAKRGNQPFLDVCLLGKEYKAKVAACQYGQEKVQIEELRKYRKNLLETISEFEIWYELEGRTFDLVAMQKDFNEKYDGVLKENTELWQKAFAYEYGMRMFFCYLAVQHADVYGKFEKGVEPKLTKLVLDFLEREYGDSVIQA